jgi:two-component system, chemotaxis family, chemotaxis protein CheY
VNAAKQRKVLVVEDSRLIHKMYEVMLQPVILISAFNGQEGLEILEQNPDVDLVILAVNMPKMTGLEFLTRMRASPQSSRIPVLIVSTDGKDADVARGLQSGASAYLKKPFAREDLLATINRLAAPQMST